MKLLYALVVSIALVSPVRLSAEIDDSTEVPRNAITIGVLQGGGSLFGVEYERLLAGNFGLEVGTGFDPFGGFGYSFDLGVTYHFDKDIDSNAIWLGTWNQFSTRMFDPSGDTSFAASFVGLTYQVRSWRWLSGEIGLGYAVYTRDDIAAIANYLSSGLGIKLPTIALLVNLGWYKGF